MKKEDIEEIEFCLKLLRSKKGIKYTRDSIKPVGIVEYKGKAIPIKAISLDKAIVIYDILTLDIGIKDTNRLRVKMNEISAKINQKQVKN